MEDQVYQSREIRLKMENLRTLRRRIRSVENTQKITRAMEMVAGAKLKRSQGELFSFRPYTQQLKRITERFLASHPTFEHPLLRSEDKMAPIGLIVIASDTGLCGTYNERILNLAERFRSENPSAQIVALGRKASRFFARRGIRCLNQWHWAGRYEGERAMEAFEWMRALYLEGRVSSWWVASTLFFSAFQLSPSLTRLLPVERPILKEIPEKTILEPDGPQVAEELLQRFLKGAFKQILLEAFTAEHSARMIAMKNATDNAAEMIDQITLIRNKVRQAAITKELIEVVSGAEALK